jgi:hypothetical protein
VNLILTSRAYHDANKGKRPEMHKKLVEAMTKAEPEKLKDTVVRLEGTNWKDDYLWKKERGEKLPWFERIGGRVWHNPKTHFLQKLLSTAGSPVTTPLVNLLRASHYNPAADAAAVYGDEPAVTTHETGHAIDFNTPKIHTPKDPNNPGSINRLGNLGYQAAYSIPVAALVHEARANMRSQAALRSGLADDKKTYDEIMARRARVLPTGYGSYVGGAAASLISPSLSAPMALAGMAGGKIYGMARPHRPTTDKAPTAQPGETTKTSALLLHYLT